METKVDMIDYVESGPAQISAYDRSHAHTEAHSSGVAWGAVIGGAFVAAAIYLLLLALGAGFGLSAISPWSNLGVSAATLGVTAIIWLFLTEIVSSSLGGYLTGRLRTKWAVLHNDEVYFRDTANGFLSWAVAFVISATLLASAAAFMVGQAAQLAPAMEAAGRTAGASDPNAYFVDQLFRSDRVASENSDPLPRAEAARIVTSALRQNALPASDQAYLARLIAARTGVSPSEADRRVADVFTEVRQAADTTRKVTSRLLLWLFLALLAGAFSASYAATVGGRQRDHVKTV